MIQRKVTGPQQALYLTFDDGPHPQDTRAVLDILDQHHAKATFFLVARKAHENADLTQEILKRGHHIGNHSLDHTYGVFFRGEKALNEWIQKAEDEFAYLGVKNLVGFRPPVGIVTPELKRALKKRKTPLILWNTRFYDSLWPWTSKKALKALEKIQPGSIVLLHDIQKPRNKQVFLNTLQLFLIEAQKKGYTFLPLPFDLQSK